jgi:hypothetical protein
MNNYPDFQVLNASVIRGKVRGRSMDHDILKRIWGKVIKFR